MGSQYKKVVFITFSNDINTEYLLKYLKENNMKSILALLESVGF